MASPRLLAKLVSTAGNLSAGAVRCAAGVDRASDAAPEIVRALLALVAETHCIGGHPDAGIVREVEGHMAALVERYGTLRLAIEALGAGAHKHVHISPEKAHAWCLIMTASVAQIESSLRRSPALTLHIGKWVSAQGDTLDGRLDAYSAWLGSRINAAVWTSALAESGGVRGQPGAALEAEEGAALDVTEFQRLFLDDKRALEGAGPGQSPRMAPEAHAPAVRLAASEQTLARVVGLIGSGQFKLAEAALPALRGKTAEVEFWTLWGDRYYFDGRYDDAIEAYRSAKSAHDDARTRRNLAATLLRSHRAPVEAMIKEAIDLLVETLRGGSASPALAGRLNALLGAAWMNHTAGERDANLRRAIESLEAALAKLDARADAAWWAEVHQGLGAAWLALPSGKKLENVQRAVTCFERAGAVWTREKDADRWASVQNSLGHAWERLPAGDRAANLQRAIAYFGAALEVRVRDENPIGWAMIQNNLGNAWVQMQGGDHRANILLAIEHHHAALEVWSSEGRRNEWAATQNNLGNAWALLPASGEEREKNLRRAIAAYKAALEVRTRAAYPSEWASTQNNLGSTLLLLPSRDHDEGLNFKEAIACFEKALEIRTREAYPLDWAKTQANLGNAWFKMPVRGRARIDALERAKECYARALVVFTPSAHQHQHEHLSQRKAEVMDLMDELQMMG